MAIELRGVIPANILPLNEDLTIDEAAYRKHVDWLASHRGLGGIACNGHAGEVVSLSRDERRHAVAVAAETIAGRVPVVSGIYAENHRQASMLARDAESEGADALLVLPPNAVAYGASSDIVYRFFAAIAEAVSLPLIAFVYPKTTGLQYSTDTLVRVCEIPSVAAVKEWSLDLRLHERNFRAIKSLGRPVSFLTSFSTNLLPALISGADGILSGHGSVIAGLQVQLFDAVRADELGQARQLYSRIQKLTSVVYREPMIDMYARMKQHLTMFGHQLTPAVRPPLTPIGVGEQQELQQALTEVYPEVASAA